MSRGFLSGVYVQGVFVQGFFVLEPFESIITTYKMDELKPISHKEFNKFIKSKGFKGRRDYVLEYLKAKFDFKPIVEKRVLVVSSYDMEPTEFHSIVERLQKRLEWEKWSLSM